MVTMKEEISEWLKSSDSKEYFELVMFLTGCDSIRDVVLFPQLKKA